MLHKTDKGLIYGVRGLIHFFKENTGFLPKEKRTHEKTYVFSHALFVMFAEITSYAILTT